MKKACIIIFSLACLLLFFTFTANAGTLLMGFKTWYDTTWDSAVLKVYSEMMTDQMKESNDITFTDIDYKSFVGSGYLAGPVLGYQTSDSKWSFSFAPMIMSSFKQDVHGTAQIPEAYGQSLPIPFVVYDKTTVDVSRVDYDFAASFSLDDYDYMFSPFKYFKLFAGFKYQKIEYEFEFTTQLLSLEETGSTSIDYEVYMPTVGIGMVYPFSEDIVAGLQGGAGIAFFEGMKVDDSLAINAEATMTITPIGDWFIQFGYRYQIYSYRMHPSETDKVFRSTDITHGPTLTVIYPFN